MTKENRDATPGTSAERRILIVAGEVSGDMHAARLVRTLKARDPSLRFVGIGGDDMAAEGVELRQHVRDMAVMGLSEVLRRYRFFRRVFFDLLHEVRTARPDAVILVDYPGFNLRFAKAAHALGVTVIYYICPQVWAWKRGRIPEMARVLDRLLTIFPFEPELFCGTGLRVDFVGHPLVDEAAKALAAAPTALPWEGRPRIAMLPGSRPHEVRRLLPVMWEAAARITKPHRDAAFLIATPSREIEALVRQTLDRLPRGPAHSAIVSGCTREVLRQADAAMVASGTATLETALMGCPMVIAYKVGALTYTLGRLLVRVNHIGMVNIVAGRRICPEFMQSEATPAALAEALAPLLTDTPARRTMREELRRVGTLLGDGGAEERAADCVLQELARPR